MIEKLKKAPPASMKFVIRENIDRIRSIGKQKIFGIGSNKTGTTSLKAAMQELGFVIGHQQTAEKLIADWGKRDFQKIIKYCKSAQFFQDIPFSKPYTYIALDNEFPNSKFILTVRDDAEEWYNSLTRFHAKKWGKGGRIPTKEDLQQATYIEEGWAWKVNRLSFDTPENDPYKKEVLIKRYLDHNKTIMEYFRHRPDDLLIINVAADSAYQKLCDFLGVEPKGNSFPWKNKTKEI